MRLVVQPEFCACAEELSSVTVEWVLDDAVWLSSCPATEAFEAVAPPARGSSSVRGRYCMEPYSGADKEGGSEWSFPTAAALTADSEAMFGQPSWDGSFAIRFPRRCEAQLP